MSLRKPLFLPPTNRILILLTVVALAPACTTKTTEIHITSFDEEAPPERFVESFPDGCYSLDARGNYNITFEIPPTRVAIVPLNNDASGELETSDASVQPPIPDEIYISQLIHIEMLWKPDPGKTFAERTQTNAGITYCLQRGNDLARYEGAGFIFFKKDDFGDRITGAIESATLYPVGATSDAVAVLGPCRIEGPFIANPDLHGVSSVKRRIRAEFSRLASYP